MKQLIAVLCMVAFAVTVAFAGPIKDYQFTGDVVEVSADKIVVKKGKENWEFAKDKDTKAMGDVKVGSKVTVKYTMKATSIEAKADKKDAKKADEKKAEPVKKDEKKK